MNHPNIANEKKNSKKSQMLKIQLYWYSNFQILKELYFVENYA
jgi:hypothetical protein